MKVAVAEREDGSLEVRPVKEIMAEIDDELAALDRLETCLLKDDEKVLACEIAKKAGADFVKTSTGFSTGGR